ncbi:MAG: ABC transporter ATP-binding protein [Bryobacteraceae bacterium]
MNAVEFEGVSKSYAVYDSPGDRLKELATLNRVSFHRDFWALRDISLAVRKGETFCIIGENGCGKSTLLQLVAGIMQPTTGSVSVNGRVSALLELGSGFNPEFSGRDNVYLNGAILGFSAKQIAAKFKSIEDFAQIGDFIEQPVKTYSSGMVVRLAFAVAIHVDPGILLVDEALAVGDICFRQRCMRKVHELRSQGVTIIFVSHATGDVKALGDRTLWLEAGRIRELGETDRVVAKYLAAMTEKDSAYLTLRKHTSCARTELQIAPETVDSIPNIDNRYGDGRAEILGIAILDSHGQRLAMLEPLSRIMVRISVRVKEYIEMPIVGFEMRNHLGIDFYGVNTASEGVDLPPMIPGDIHTVDFRVDLPELYASFFSFSPAIAEGTVREFKICDYIDNAITLQMGRASGEIYGYMRLPCRIELNSRLSPGAAAEPESQHD